MTNFNFGHASLFWEEILYAVETVDELSEQERSISLVSPWIRDLNLSSSNMSSDEWAEVLKMPGETFSNLSDVLLALSCMGFSITILTLDSEDKALPKQDRAHLVKEERFVKKLTNDSTGGNISVLKKFGIHNKLYCFPWSVLLGSVNMTHRGMLGNSESLTLISREDNQAEYLDCIINLNSLLNGSVDYDLGTVVRVDVSGNPNIESGSLPSNMDYSGLDTIRQEEGRLFSMGIELPEKDGIEDRFLVQEERQRINRETAAFENELRQFILNYYKKYGQEVKSWAVSGFKNPAKHWHKLIHVSTSETLHQKAGAVIKSKKLRPTDIPGGRVPDWKNLSPDEAIMKGTTLGDLRVALLGIVSDGILPLEDFSGNDLADRGVIRLTGDLRNQKSSKEDSQYFWSKYFGAKDTAFDDIYWVRNALAHHDDISVERAWAATNSMKTIRRAIFKPWYKKHLGDTMP